MGFCCCCCCLPPVAAAAATGAAPAATPITEKRPVCTTSSVALRTNCARYSGSSAAMALQAVVRRVCALASEPISERVLP